MEFFGLGILAFIAVVVFSIAAFVFWIWMLIEVLTRETSDGDTKLVWALVLIFLQGLGALIYFFVRRPQRITEEGH